MKLTRLRKARPVIDRSQHEQWGVELQTTQGPQREHQEEGRLRRSNSDKAMQAMQFKLAETERYYEGHA